MANAYARHINGDALERAIFLYDYVVVVDLPERSNVLTGTTVLSDTRDPCFYARRQRRRLYMGYVETAESSPEITREVARQTLEEAKRIFPALARPRRARHRQRLERPGVLHLRRLSVRGAPFTTAA